MTEQPPLATGSQPEPSAQEVAQSIRSMSESQLDELIGLLRQPPNTDRKSAGVGAGAEEARINSEEPGADQPSGDGIEGLVVGLGARLGAALHGARSVASERDFWKSSLANLLPWALALALAPIVVPWSFERDRAAAKPKISIEYAFLSRQSQSIPNDVANQITEASRQSIYRAFVQSRLMSGARADMAAFLVPGSRLGPEMRQQLLVEAAALREYLDQLQKELGAQKSSLAQLPEEELRSFAFSVLDDPSSLDEANPREFLSKALSEKASSVASLRELVAKLENIVTTSVPEIRVRLTLLNRGATDGLVRHHGEIKYRGETYSMTRTAPPSSDLNQLAVPVFQTNAGGDDFSAGSVGKIEQDSMGEFWYAFRPKPEPRDADLKTLCRPGERVSVLLYDQNRSAVRGTVECNQEEG